jgi:Kef-type K+ transport system membrane component KefB/mannitol/fructose-specific phosphotransferase system IIA component (Ntr-type)
LTSLSLPITDPVLIVAVAMIVFLVAPLAAERFRVPGLIGLILAGAVIGPHGLGVLARDNTIILLGTVGLLYLVFLAGLELDLHRFGQYRRRSIIFGTLSFGIPMVLAVAVMPFLGFGWAASLLMGSIIGSHTLLAYPIISRLGLVKNAAVTTVVGGTLMTDTLALGVLAIVAGSVGGGIGVWFWLQLLGGLVLYTAVIFFGVPRLGRWFFRNTSGHAPTEFVFLLVILFTSAYLATLAGAQPIIGAFLAGLTLNRLIPNEGPHMTRARFMGNAFFIPFFLLSVGMLVDVEVVVGRPEVWAISGTIIILLMIGKFAGAIASRMLFHYSKNEGVVMFGLSLPQAAATLAVTFIGLEVGLFDEVVVNAVVVMILVTGVIGPSLVERFGHHVALEEEQKPLDAADTPQRILVPMANPATADDLMALALLIREPSSQEAIYPVTVVPGELDRSDEQVALAERMLSHAVAYAAAADVPVIPITRMDHNFANGIARGVAETRGSILIIGWDGRRSPRRGMFGSVLDQLLELLKQQVMVAKLGHPLNTTRRIVVLVPHGTDHLPGYAQAIRTVKRMASELGATIHGYTVRSDPEKYLRDFKDIGEDVPTTLEHVRSWSEVLDRLGNDLRRDDLVVVVSARRGAVSWVPMLDRLPGNLARLVPESFIMMYPSEQVPTGSRQRFAEEVALPTALDATRVVFRLPNAPYHEIIQTLLETEFGADQERLDVLKQALVQSAAREMRSGVVLVHARIEDLESPLLFLGISPRGIVFPGISEPARLIFLLLVPENHPEEYLTQSSSLARLVRQPDRVERMTQARDVDELLSSAKNSAEGAPRPPV